MSPRFHIITGVFLLFGTSNTLATLSRDETLDILQRTPFAITHRVSDLPVADLEAAGVIPSGRSIRSLIVNPGAYYQQHPASIDPSKPSSQLIFAGIAKDYILCCFWAGGLTETEHVILVRRDGLKSKLLLHTWVSPEARDVGTLRRFLARERWEPFDLREKNAFN